MAEELRLTFLRLQPLCSHLVALSSSSSSQQQAASSILADLARQVPTLPPLGLHRCLDYLLRPLLSLLHGSDGNLGQIQLEMALDVIRAALERCGELLEGQGEVTLGNPRSVEIFHTCVEILSTDAQKKRAHEDTRLQAVRCLCTLIRTRPASEASSSQEASPPFAPSKSGLALTAYGISLLIDEATTATNRQLRVAALEALYFLCTRLAPYKSGEVVAFMLPGLVSGLGKIIMGDFKQGHGVVQAALNLCEEIVSTVMSDDANRLIIRNLSIESANRSNPEQSVDRVASLLASLAEGTKKGAEAGDKGKEKQSEEPPLTTQTEPSEPFTIIRDRQWLEKTTANLRGLFGEVFQVSKNMLHQHWRVRKSLAHCAARFMMNCRITLESCSKLFISTLVFLANDDIEEVSSTARAAIQVINREQGDKIDSYLSENMAEGQLSSLPRYMRDPDESTKLMAIRFLFNHIYLLQDRMVPLLASSSFLARLAIALLQILEFDPYDVQTHSGSGFQSQLLCLTRSSPVNGAQSEAEKEQGVDDPDLYPKRNFHHFRSEAVENMLKMVCRYLGRYGDIRVLLDYFLQVVHDPRNGAFRNQALYIINNVLLGAAGIGLPAAEKSGPDLSDQVELILDEYLDESLWGLPSVNMPHLPTILSINVLNENAISLSLLIEGVGNCAQILGTAFDQHLMKVLHPLLEKLGNANGLVNRSAFATLQRVCGHCHYASLPKLIQCNTDYLVDSISMRMKHLDLYPDTPQVLRAILDYGILKADVLKESDSPTSNEDSQVEEIVWLLDDTIQSVFNGLDEHNTGYTLTFFRILEAIVGVLAHRYERKGWTTKIDNPDVDLLSLTMLPMDKHVDNSSPLHDCNTNEAEAEGRGDEPVSVEEEEPEKTDAEKIEEIDRFFKEYHEKKQVESKEAQDKNPDDEEDEQSKQPYSKSFNKEQDTVVKILERCQHFVSSRSRQVRVCILEIISRSMAVLSADRKRLLPAVHLIWRPLSTKFVEQDRVQAIKSWEVVSCIALHAGDFVFHRVKDDFWPALRNHVIPTDFAALQNEMRSLGSFSSANSLVLRSQHCLLRCLSDLCRFVFARMSNFGSSTSAQELVVDIFGVIYIYLDKALPSILRGEAVELIKRLTLLAPRTRTQLKTLLEEATSTTRLCSPLPTSYSSVISPRIKEQGPLAYALDVKQAAADLVMWLDQC